MSIYGHHPIARRSGDVEHVNDTAGPWVIRARERGVHEGEGRIFGTQLNRSDAIAIAMRLAHGDRHGDVTSYNHVSIGHADDAPGNQRWSAAWYSGDGIWREYGRTNDRSWTFSGRHAHALVMAAYEPSEDRGFNTDGQPGFRPVVTVNGRRYQMADERGGVWSFLRPDGQIGYATPMDPREPGALAAKVAEALAKPTRVCETCGAGSGEYCRPVAGEPGATEG